MSGLKKESCPNLPDDGIRLLFPGFQSFSCHIWAVGSVTEWCLPMRQGMKWGLRRGNCGGGRDAQKNEGCQYLFTHLHLWPSAISFTCLLLEASSRILFLTALKISSFSSPSLPRPRCASGIVWACRALPAQHSWGATWAALLAWFHVRDLLLCSGLIYCSHDFNDLPLSKSDAKGKGVHFTSPICN